MRRSAYRALHRPVDDSTFGLGWGAVVRDGTLGVTMFQGGEVMRERVYSEKFKSQMVSKMGP